MKRLFGAAALIGGLGLSVFAQDSPLGAPPVEDEAIAPVEDPAVVDDPLDSDALETPAEQLPPADQLPGVDVPPENELDSPAEVVEPADPGAAAVSGSALPRDLPGDDLAPPIVVDPADPLADEPLTDDPLTNQPLVDPAEERSLPADPALSEPLGPGREIPPAAPRRPARPDEFDPAYGAPAPPRRNQPQIEIGDVVRNPVRIYDARLLVLMGHTDAALESIDTLAGRFPTDARVPYMRFFTLSRSGQRDAALDALQQAISLERLYPMTDYNRFMEPLQGPDRFYLERVRRAASELAAVDGLVEPTEDEVIPAAPEE